MRQHVNWRCQSFALRLHREEPMTLLQGFRSHSNNTKPIRFDDACSPKLMLEDPMAVEQGCAEFFKEKGGKRNTERKSSKWAEIETRNTETEVTQNSLNFS